MQRKYEYDVIIIGAGISGLICGCYLARAGLKTLIVEKNTKPGGYCTSFQTSGFHFDACVHALSSLREDGGVLRRIINDLGVADRIKFNRHNPSDIIITPDFKISFFHEMDRTIEEFQKYFPNEKGPIKKFFKYIVSSQPFFEIRNKTLNEILNKFFDDVRLKAILATMIYLTLGCPTDKVSATVACLLYKEFFFGGGYYPVGGIQALPDILKHRFIELNGYIIFSKAAKKIRVKNNIAEGIELKSGKFLSARYIVSACDAWQTFLTLIGEDVIDKATKNKINKTPLSTSYFLAYLGVDRDFSEISDLKSAIIIMDSYDFNIVSSGVETYGNNFVSMRVPSIWDDSLNAEGKESICLATNAVYKSEKFWNDDKKQKITVDLVKLTEKVIPNLSKNIVAQMTATPHTLSKWTFNHEGAAYGWASTFKQFGNLDFTQKTEIKNLYLTGHWSNQSSGVSLVANCGHTTANMILLREKRI